jgi:DNA polymerase III alpha subunit
MSEYEVNWRIQVEAETPDEAAREALAIMRDQFSEATFFEVTDRETGETETIDAALLEVAEDLDNLALMNGFPEELEFY